MDFNVNDFFLLEADDEAKKEENEKKDEDKKDDEKKEKESESKEDKKEEDDKSSDEDDSEYNDLMDDDNADSESSDDADIDSSDDEYNDLMDDDIGDLSVDDDEPVADDSSDDGDYNALIVVKGGDSEGGASGSVYDALAKLGYLYVVISNNMKHIHLNCAGRKFDELHRQSEEYYYHFNEKADQYFELAAESPMIKLDNPTRSKEHVEDIDVESEENYTFETGISRMSNNLNKAIEYLKTTREKAGDDRTDIQSTLDEELTYLNKQYNFILRKKMINDDTVTSDISESYNYLF